MVCSTQVALHGWIGVNLKSDELLYASLSAGVEFFLGHWGPMYEHDPEEEVCLDLLGAVGLSYNDRALTWGTELGAGFSSGNAYSSGKTVYY